MAESGLNLEMTINCLLGGNKMVFGWLDAREAKEFGASLARYYLEHAPLNAPDRKRKRKTSDIAVLNKMAQQINRFQQAHKMNFYKKAQFGTAFKCVLVEAGFEDSAADELTRLLLINLR